MTQDGKTAIAVLPPDMVECHLLSQDGPLVFETAEAALDAAQAEVRDRLNSLAAAIAEDQRRK